jgi:hypothetical protein
VRIGKPQHDGTQEMHWSPACIISGGCSIKGGFMKGFALLTIFAFGVLHAAGAQNPPVQPKEPVQMHGMTSGMMTACPTSLEGTSVAVADTGTGVAVTFTTKPENVAELRKRVEQMAAMHAPAAGNSNAMMQGQMMPGTVKYDSVDNGARLTLTPKDPSKLAEFRKQVRDHVDHMTKGDCSMMQDMVQGMMHGMGNMGKSKAAEEKPEPAKK